MFSILFLTLVTKQCDIFNVEDKIFEMLYTAMYNTYIRAFAIPGFDGNYIEIRPQTFWKLLVSLLGHIAQWNAVHKANSCNTEKWYRYF